MPHDIAVVRGRPPSERRFDPNAPKRQPLLAQVDYSKHEGRALGEILGVRWGLMQGWEKVDASTTQPPATYTFDIGLTLTGTSVNLDPAKLAEIGGLLEAPSDGKFYARQNALWAELAGGVPPAYTFDTGLTLTGSSVNLDPATATTIGGITEPAADGLYLRRAAGTAYTWEVAAAGTAYIWGIGIDEGPPGTINLIPATAAELGGVTVVPRSNVQGLDLAASGALTAPLATDLLAGSIVEPLPDGLQYVRTRTAAGVSSWVAATTASLIWGIGIDEDTTTPGTIHLQPANFTPGEIGGVTSEARSLTQGLLLDEATGHLTAPIATDLLAGSIVEPAPDGLTYGRSRDVAGVSTWKPVSAVFIGDAPPPTPTVGLFWYDSNSGKLYLFVDDGNSQQFIQVGGV